MKTTTKFTPVVLAAAALSIAALSNGCSAAGGVCCTDYKPGTDMATFDVGLTGAVKGQFSAFAQGAGDLVAAVGALDADVTAACKGIAVDLGADSAEPDQAKLAGKKPVEYWCNLATTNIGSFKGAATITLVYEAPACRLDIQASGSCNAHCDVSGMCDVNATPPKCTGGTLEVSCKGTCDVQSPGVSFDCEGSCMGGCSGGCEATGGATVMCNGKCDGTCSMIDGMGNCMGTCSGKCTYAAMAKATCSGTCRGQCDAKCTAAVMGGSVKCSGKCDVMATPLECKGGKLEVMCNVDASCKANCDASVSAKANCTSPVMKVTLSGTLDAKLNQLRATLEKNLPAIAVAVKARTMAFVTLIQGTISAGASVSAKIDASNLRAVSCGVIIASSIGAATPQATATIGASAQVGGAVGM